MTSPCTERINGKITEGDGLPPGIENTQIAEETTTLKTAEPNVLRHQHMYYTRAISALRATEILLHLVQVRYMCEGPDYPLFLLRGKPRLTTGAFLFSKS
jgi:hypothetical protein